MRFADQRRSTSAPDASSSHLIASSAAKISTSASDIKSSSAVTSSKVYVGVPPSFVGRDVNAAEPDTEPVCRICKETAADSGMVNVMNL